MCLECTSYVPTSECGEMLNVTKRELRKTRKFQGTIIVDVAIYVYMAKVMVCIQRTCTGYITV